MTSTLTIYYQETPLVQVSLDTQEWITISGYNNHQQPYFNFNDKPDWCTVSTSKSGEWLICFAKLQNNGVPLYYQGFIPFIPLNQLAETFVFNCYEVIKGETTQKWVKKA